MKVFLMFGVEQQYLGWIVDDEGMVLGNFLQPKRDKRAATKRLRKVIKRAVSVLHVIVSDDWRSTAAAIRAVVLGANH